jgi:uncharacterized delta-60 repeat protein
MPRPRVGLIVALVLVVLAAPTAAADPGDLDPTFSEDGWLRTPEILDDYGTEPAEEILIQADGKIVVVGTVERNGSWFFGVARYLPDGELDPEFGRGGAVVTDFGGIAFANGAALHSDGTIVVVGEGDCEDVFGVCFALAKYLPTGQRDWTFGGDGRVAIDFGFCGCEAWDVAIQPDGKVLAVGISFEGGDANDDGLFAVARYAVDGTLDSTFSDDGKLRVDFGYGDDYAFTVAIAPDGKILVAGEGTRNLYKSGGDFALVRLNPDGSFDSTFGRNGWRTVSFGGDRYDRIEGLAIQPDGKILAAGQSATVFGEDQTIALARLNPDGTLDPSFSGDGRIVTRVEGRPSWSNAIVPHDGGTVVVGGAVDRGSGNGWDFALLRFTSDGELDPAFSDDGLVVSDFGTGEDFVTSLAVQEDRKIVAAGSVYTTFAIARYLAD